MSTAGPHTRLDAQALRHLLRALPGYTPEFAADISHAGYALMQMYAHLSGIVDSRIDEMPARERLACLDMLGMHLLPASAARAPLVFTLAPDSPVDVTLPAGSQVAAIPAAAPPAPGAAPAPASDPVIFATESTVTLTPGHLVTLYSVDPASDQYADYSSMLSGGFTLFDAMTLTPHHLYLGHDSLFALGGSVTLIISFVLQRPAMSPVDLAWEYLADAGWLPLPYTTEDDTTGGLTADGQVTLSRDCGPNAKKTSIPGIDIESFWIRARLTTPLELESVSPLVDINDLSVRIAVRKDNLSLDTAFADAIALDVTKDFYPFGVMPTLASTFYFACRDAFSRPGASVSIAFVLSDNVTVTAQYLVLEWEYSGGNGWTDLAVAPKTPAYTFEKNATVVFTSPGDWSEVDVNGVKQRWVRVRITSGNYGRPPYVASIDNTSKQPIFAGGDLAAPTVKAPTVSFQQLTAPATLDHCFTYNDFVYQDVTQAAQWPDGTFIPFTPVADRAPAVHLGVDRAFPDGLASLFIEVNAQEPDTPSASPFVWEYRTAAGWNELAVLDETQGFASSGMIQFIGPQDAAPSNGLGGVTYQLRARVKAGELAPTAELAGIWLNAVWASQRNTVTRELAGRSDGNPKQTFQLTRSPVLEGELVEVEEWDGRGDAWRAVLADVSLADIRLDTDPATGEAITAWVRWQERDDFYSSTKSDRNYTIERATGTLQFGLNVPAAGKRIVASYTSGGGLGGNVAAGAIKQLRTAAPYVIGASNVIAAQGGADGEQIAAISLRGPQHLRHRNRGLSAQDCEKLALEASAEVARVRCSPVTGSDGRAQRGWVTFLVIPNSREAQPALTQELALEVRGYVSARMPAGVRVRVVGPDYSLVSVRAVVIPAVPGDAAIVEADVRSALNSFLHPLRGGRGGRGWGFGEPVYLSHVASIIENVDGVDHAEAIELRLDGVLAGMSLAIPGDKLVSAGAHELVLRVGVN